LRIQKIPIIGRLLRPYLNCIFDDDIKYGDIVKGLPVPAGQVEGVFCSHVLEHLALDDFHKALDNTYLILKPGGLFRLIVPDLELYILDYINSLSTNSFDIKCRAASEFMKKTGLGMIQRKHGITGRLSEVYGSHHRWMWDKYSLSRALTDHGFVKVETFEKGNCHDEMFLLPERDYQFNSSIALQCRKPDAC